MIYIVLNIGPILLAAVAGLAVGAAYRGATGGLARRGAVILITAFLAQVWFACILAGALIVAPPMMSPWTMAIASAVVIWLGFVVPVLVTSGTEKKVSSGTILNDCVYWLLVMLTQTVVMKGMGLAPSPAP